MESTTAITRNCAIAAGCARHDANFRAHSLRCRSLGKRCRPRGAAGQDRPHAPGPVVLPTCCAPGRLPTCCPWCCRPVNSRPVAPTLPAGHSGSVAGPVVLPGQDRPHAPGPVVLPTCCAPGRLPTCCPWCCAAGHTPGRSLGKRCRPVVLPVKIGPTLPARGAADVLRCRPVADVLPVVLPAGQLPAGCPHAPGRSLGKRCRPRGAARSRSAPRSRPRGAADVLRCPAGCRRAARAALPVNSRPVTREALPARGAARSRSAPRSRPGAADVLRRRCRRAARGAAGRVNSRPVAPRSRPVTREALPAPWCCPVKIGPTLPARGAADVLRSRPVADAAWRRPVRLPSSAGQSVAGPWCCRSRSAPRSRPRGAADVLRSRPVADVLPGRSLPAGSTLRPVTREALPARGAAGQDRPHAPGPWCCRGAAHIGCAGRNDCAGCAGAILGSLTVLRGSPEKPCAGFSPGWHLRNIWGFRPADRDQRAAIRAAGLGRRSGRRSAG